MIGENDLFSLLSEVKKETEKLRVSLKISEENSIIAFRGEPQEYGRTKLLPSLYRTQLSIRQERKLFELLNDYDVIGKEEETNLQKAIASQHYLAISRLLDISFNVLVAIYFATSHKENEDDENGYLYIFCLPQHFSPSSKYIEQYYNSMLSEGSDKLILKKTFKVITHGYFNERIKLQSGGFIFFPSSNITRIPECFYTRIEIDGQQKKKIRKQLEEFFAIYESSIFPEKEKMRDVIVKSIQKKIEDYSNEESIKSELDMYFENLRYEINSHIHAKETKKNLMRRLRKYESDLNLSLDELEKITTLEVEDNYFEDIKKRITHDFKNLKIYAEGEIEKCI